MPRKNVTLASGDTAHLTEFAHGEDVGHGVDHDCAACRINRQALKNAGLHASDIQGLAGGSAPAAPVISDNPEGNPFVPFGHNEIAAICRDMLTKAGIEPNTKDHMIYDFAAGYNGQRTEAAVREVFAERIEADAQAGPLSPDEQRDDDEYIRGLNEQRAGEEAAEDNGTADRHRRLIALSSRLDDVLLRVMVPRGFSPNLIDGHDTDIAEAIIDNSGRFMLMAGFIPDDRDWHCEIGIGSERSHVQHPDQGIAIRLAMLLALDPKAGSPLNSAFMQLVEEGKPRAVTRHWVGTGVQP